MEVPSAPSSTRDWLIGFANDLVDDPVDAFARTMREGPVVFLPGPKYSGYVVTRHDDVIACLTDFKTFSSDVFDGNRRFRDPQIPPELAARASRVWESASRLVEADPPEHTAMRRIINTAFTRQRLAELEEPIRESAGHLIEAFRAKGSCDLMSHYCFPLAMAGVTELMGLPRDDMQRMAQFVIDTIRLSSDPANQLEREEWLALATRWLEAREYLAMIAEDRARDPATDLISSLAAATDGTGRPALSRETIVSRVSGILLAGLDTTSNALANSVILFSRHPDQWESVKRDPQLVANAVDESLRRHSSVYWTLRKTTRDADVAGTIIPAGSTVLLSLAGASNDPEHFPHPERFDVRRENARQHVAFAKGAHRCVGAGLARLELRIGLEALFQAIPDLRVSSDDPPVWRSLAVPARRTLQVTWKTTRGSKSKTIDSD